MKNDLEVIGSLSKEELMNVYVDCEEYYHNETVEEHSSLGKLMTEIYGEFDDIFVEYICLQVYRCIANKAFREVLL